MSDVERVTVELKFEGYLDRCVAQGLLADEISTMNNVFGDGTVKMGTRDETILCVNIDKKHKEKVVKWLEEHTDEIDEGDENE